MENPMPRRPPPPPPPPAPMSRQRSEQQIDSEGGRLTLTAAAGGGGVVEGQKAVRRVTRSRGPGGSVSKGPSSQSSTSQRKPAKTNAAAAAAAAPVASVAGSEVRRSRHYTDPDQKAATVALKAARLIKATTSTTPETAGSTTTAGKSTGNLAMPMTAPLRPPVPPLTSGLPPATMTRASLLGSTTSTLGAGGQGTGLGSPPQASTVGMVAPRVAPNVPSTIVAMVNAPVKMRMPPPAPVSPLTPPLEEKEAAQKVVRAEAAAWAEAAAAQLAVAEAAEAVAKGAASRAVEEQKRAAAAQAMAERRWPVEAQLGRPRVATCATAHTIPLLRDQLELAVMKPVASKPVPPAAAGITARPSRGPSITSSKMTAKTTPLTSKQSLSSSTGTSLKAKVSSPPVTTTTGTTLTSTGVSETLRGEAGETSTSFVVSGENAVPRGRVWEALGVEATTSQRRAARRMAWAASQKNPMPTHWADLPKEVLVRVFMYFSEKELASRLSLVCRPWRQAARHPLLWRQLAFRGDRVSTVVINRLLRTSPKLQSLRLDAVPDAPTIIRQLCRCNTEVRTVIVRDCTFGKDEVVPESVFRNLIMCCPRISKLDLQGTQFSALRFFQDIIKLPSLRSLNVGDNRFLKVQDLMALSLNCQGLQQLQVARRPARPPFPQLTDNDVQYMFTHLKESLLALAFDCVGLGDSSLRAILKCSLLRKLELNNARDFSGRELRHIGDRLRCLTKLKLTHACQMRTPDFRALFGPSDVVMSKALEDVEAARVGEEVSPSWSTPLRELIKVDLRSCWAMEDEGLRAVVDANCRTLESLCLKGCQTITSMGLKYVVDHCVWLRHLNVAFALTQGSVLDPLLDAPVAMPRLRRVVVDMAHRRSPVLPRLKKRMPNLLILGSFSEYSDDESLLNFVSTFDQPPTPLSGLLTTESSTSPLTLTSASTESKEVEI